MENITKEALVEDAERNIEHVVSNQDIYNDPTPHIKKIISTALDRYGTAQRAEERERIGRALKQSWDKRIEEEGSGADWDLGDALKTITPTDTPLPDNKD